MLASVVSFVPVLSQNKLGQVAETRCRTISRARSCWALGPKFLQVKSDGARMRLMVGDTTTTKYCFGVQHAPLCCIFLNMISEAKNLDLRSRACICEELAGQSLQEFTRRLAASSAFACNAQVDSSFEEKNDMCCPLCLSDTGAGVSQAADSHVP